MKILLLAVLFLSIEIFTLPRFALRTGSKCGDCHFNPTGGAIRNTRGFNFGKEVLPMKRIGKNELENSLNNNIYYGVDYRAQLLGFLTDSVKRVDFQNMSASVYTGLQLSDEISGVLRYDLIQQLFEGFVTLNVLPAEGYIKVGAFVPNFGLKMDDHTIYTRGGDLGLATTTLGLKQGLIFKPNYSETGLEVGFAFFDELLWTASVGQPSRQLFRSDPSYTTSLTFLSEVSEDVSLMLGGSYHNMKDNRFNTEFQPIAQNVNMYGGHLGFNFKWFNILAEYDIANDYIAKDTVSAAAFVETDITLFKGLDLILRYEMFDPSVDNSEDNLNRVVAGFEIFPYSFVEIRPQYRYQFDKNDLLHDAFLVQFHFYY